MATTEDISENVILKILVIKGYGTDNPLQNTYSQKNYYFNWKAFSVLDIFCIFCIPFSVSSLSSANLKWETWIASALFKKKTATKRLHNETIFKYFSTRVTPAT